MQTEEHWAERIAGEDYDTDEAAQKYEFFMSKEPREELGPIEEIDDPYLGKTKVREVKIGMTRNAKVEDKMEVLAYLQPVPHIRIDKAKMLQGWYKSLHEPEGVRPRPCLLKRSLVNTPTGDVPIELITKGSSVLGCSLQNNAETVATLVEGTANKVVTEYLELELDNGTHLRLTKDHLVFTKNRGWVEAGSLTLQDDLMDIGG